METLHNKSEILDYLKTGSLGILGTNDAGNVRQRVMYYGIDDDFNCYLMSTKESPKMDQIRSSSKVSLIILTIEDPYDKSWEIEISGFAQLISDKEEIDFALDNLKGKNPFADVVLESGISAQFDFVKLVPDVVRFRNYGEALNGNSPTILEMKHSKD